ncbi:unnamed protein product, partial [Mesorhabditis spiculigera]
MSHQYSPTSGQLILKWYGCPAEGCPEFFSNPDARRRHVLAAHTPRTWDRLDDEDMRSPHSTNSQTELFRGRESPKEEQRSTATEGSPEITVLTMLSPVAPTLVSRGTQTDEDLYCPRCYIKNVGLLPTKKNIPPMPPMRAKSKQRRQISLAPRPPLVLKTVGELKKARANQAKRYPARSSSKQLEKQSDIAKTYERPAGKEAETNFSSKVVSDGVLTIRKVRSRKPTAQFEIPKSTKKNAGVKPKRRLSPDTRMLEQLKRVLRKRLMMKPQEKLTHGSCSHANQAKLTSPGSKRLRPTVVMKAFQECLKQGCAERQNFWAALKKHLLSSHVVRQPGKSRKPRHSLTPQLPAKPTLRRSTRGRKEEKHPPRIYRSSSISSNSTVSISRALEYVRTQLLRHVLVSMLTGNMMPQEYYSPTSGQLVVKWYCCPSEGCGRFYRDPEAPLPTPNSSTRRST